MWSSTGKQLGAVPNGPVRDPDRGSVVVRRSALHSVLREAVLDAGIPFAFDARLERIEESDAGVRATFADGRTATGDVLIGADGVGSRTRRHIDPDAPEPRFSRLVGLGGFAGVPGLAPTPGAQHMVFGRRSFFGYLVRDDAEVYWFANVTTTEGDRADLRGVSGEEWLARLRELHADDPFPVPQILAHATGEFRGYPIEDLPRVPHWSRGRVVAIGDAVHAISPSAGQGASLALEDAITLARCLRDADHHDRVRGVPATAAASRRSRRPLRRGDQQAEARHRTRGSASPYATRCCRSSCSSEQRDDARNDWLYNHRDRRGRPVSAARDSVGRMQHGFIFTGTDPNLAVELAPLAEASGWDAFFVWEGIWADRPVGDARGGRHGHRAHPARHDAHARAPAPRRGSSPGRR